MNKKVLLGAAISLASLQAYAVPFQVIDARTMGMGGAGVAGAPLSASVPYNPALLATQRDDDHFSFNLRGGFYVGDADDVLDETQDFEPDVKADNLSELLDSSDPAVRGIVQELEALESALGSNTQDNSILGAIADLETAISGNDVAGIATANSNLQQANDDYQNAITGLTNKAGSDGELTTLVLDLTDYLDNTLSDSRIIFGGGFGTLIAVPSKKLGVGINIDSSISGSGIVTVSRNDTALLEDYATSLGKLVDDTASSASDIGGFTSAVSALADTTDGGDPTSELNAVNGYLNGDIIDEFQKPVNSTYAGDNNPSDPLIVNGEVTNTEPDLESTMHFYGAVITDIGIGIAREFNIKGKDIAIGITPKIQQINVFDFIAEVDGDDPDTGEEIDFDNIEFEDYHEDYSSFNLDVGAVHKLGYNNRWSVGGTIKNIMGKEYESAKGQKVKVAPLVRAGMAYQNIDYFLKPKFMLDLDLTENKPTAFEDPSRYLALGGELDLFRWIQVRAGYRNNLSSSDESLVTAGIGVSPFFMHVDFGVYANPSDWKKQAGFAVDLGVEF